MHEYKIRNENFADRVKGSFARQGFMNFLDARLTLIEPGSVEIQIPYRKELTQQHEFFHGGVIGTIADNAGGYSAFTLMAKTDSVLSIEFKLNFMSPARGDLLIARGNVLRPGRLITTCKAEIYTVHNGQEKLCASMLGTFLTMENASDVPDTPNSVQ